MRRGLFFLCASLAVLLGLLALNGCLESDDVELSNDSAQTADTSSNLPVAEEAGISNVELAFDDEGFLTLIDYQEEADRLARLNERKLAVENEREFAFRKRANNEIEPPQAPEEADGAADGYLTETILNSDAFVWQTTPDTNYGSDPATYAGHAPNGHLLLRSFYSSYTCPAVCEGVKSAVLRLYIDVNALTAAQSFTVRRVNDAWTEGGVTWNNQPVNTGVNDDTSVATALTGWYNFNATTAVTEVCEDGLTNNGIRIAGFTATDKGDLVFRGSESYPTEAPRVQIACWIPGDTCDFVLPITVNTPVNGDTTTAQADDVSVGCGGNDNDLFYYFTGTAGTSYVVDMLGSGGMVDTAVSVRTDCDNSASQIDCNDDTGGLFNWSQVVFTAPSNGTYYVLADGLTGSAGPFTLNVCDGCVIDHVCYPSGTENPANQCQECNVATSQLAWTNKADTTPCDDGSFCTDPDTCVAGACTAGPARDCDDSLWCTGAETCNEATDVCDNEFDNATTFRCPDDTLFCTGVESCDETADACVASGDPCPDDTLFCTGVESCDETTDACVASGDPCDADETCNETTDTCDENVDDDTTDDDVDDDVVDDDMVDDDVVDDDAVDDDEDDDADDDATGGGGGGGDDDDSGCGC